MFFFSTSKIIHTILSSSWASFNVVPQVYLLEFDQESRLSWIIWSKRWVLRVRFYIIVRASEEICWRLFPLSLITVSEADVGKEGRNSIHEVEKKQAKSGTHKKNLCLHCCYMQKKLVTFAIELYMCLTEDSEKLKKGIW